MPEHPFRHAIGALTGGESPEDAQIRHAAWVARCVGRGAAAPLSPGDVAALAGTLVSTEFSSGTVLFAAGQAPSGVWIVRQGQIELAVGSGRRRVVVDVMRAGDVDGDIALLLEMPNAYTARALHDSTCLCLAATHSKRYWPLIPTLRVAGCHRWLNAFRPGMAGLSPCWAGPCRPKSHSCSSTNPSTARSNSPSARLPPWWACNGPH